MKSLAERLCRGDNISDVELISLINGKDEEELIHLSDKVRRSYYGDKVFIRGLIEISSYCKNDCLYCGIRASNKEASRYRLTAEEIIACVKKGAELGFSTFVLQGGEDPYFTDLRICKIVEKIKEAAPDAAVTLSLGEKSRNAYKMYFDAGACRYLLRHETADLEHYRKLHPDSMSLENRKRCLFDLKEIGYQVGSGFMVGSPYQTIENLLEDIKFLKELDPAMIGIGPFVPHKDTPFGEFSQGSVELTVRMIAILRLIFPKALIPATTALGTLSPDGREKGLMAGANVVMPNLSPVMVRKKYNLYDNKLATGAESAEGLRLLEDKIRNAGYVMSMERGDSLAV